MTPKTKLSLTQRAINSTASLGRSKQLPFESLELEKPKSPATTLLEDIEIATEETVLPSNELHITKKLPQDVAILYIYPNGTDEYCVWGGNAVSRLSQTKPNKRPDISLGNLVQQTEKPENIRDKVYYFSLINVELRKWLKQLRNKFNEQLCLVISDHTDFEIPWEMLELSPDGSPNEYVGALITTVRWRKVISSDDNSLLLDFKSDECCGNAVAYILDTELNGIEPELNILEQLQAVIFRSSQHQITEFKTYLQRNDRNSAFVYISCHGNFRSNPAENFIGSQLNKQQQLKLLELRRCQLNLIKNSQGIVFINACHSGREQGYTSIPNNYRMSFIELFLAKGARGVIGTMGAVGNSHAAKFACYLIEESLNSPNLSVAGLLRKIRLKMVANLPNEPTPQQLLSLIYTFMYVYYGNPMTILRLTPTGEKPYV
jgi:CHAT domain